MGIDLEVFVNRDYFRTFPQLLCVFCSKATEDPVEGECGHTFCRGCVWGREQCPVCTSRINNVRPCPLLLSMLSSLDSLCLHCSWSGPLSARPNHLSSCRVYQDALRGSVGYGKSVSGPVAQRGSGSKRGSDSMWDPPLKGNASSSSHFSIDEEYEVEDSSRHSHSPYVSPYGSDLAPEIPRRPVSKSVGLPSTHRFPVAKSTVTPSGHLICSNCGGTKSGDVDQFTRLCSWCTKWG